MNDLQRYQASKCRSSGVWASVGQGAQLRRTMPVTFCISSSIDSPLMVLLRENLSDCITRDIKRTSKNNWKQGTGCVCFESSSGLLQARKAPLSISRLQKIVTIQILPVEITDNRSSVQEASSERLDISLCCKVRGGSAIGKWDCTAVLLAAKGVLQCD